MINRNSVTVDNQCILLKYFFLTQVGMIGKNLFFLSPHLYYLSIVLPLFSFTFSVFINTVAPPPPLKGNKNLTVGDLSFSTDHSKFVLVNIMLESIHRIRVCWRGTVIKAYLFEIA